MDRLKEILDILEGSPNRMREVYFEKYHKDVYDLIIEFTRGVSDIPFKFKVWHWVNDISDYPICECGNRVTRHISWKDGYRKWCSAKCSANSTEKKLRTASTLTEKYGVSHYSKTNEYKDKVRKTSIEKWGVDNYSKTEDYKTKSKKTYQRKYGVDSFTKTDLYKIKSKKTCLEKYGVDSYTKTEECKLKIKESLLNQLGTDMIFKSDDYRKKNFLISNDDYYVEYLSEFLSSIYDGEMIRNYREEFEIDVYLPDMKIGIEFNGLYWHSDLFKSKSYHLDKTNYFKQKGIRIIHIWEDDWIVRQNIVKSQIRNLLNKNSHRIFARNCIVAQITTEESKKFLDENHIQGSVKSNIKLGLFFNDKLVSVMTFDKYEGRKKLAESEWNLTRFCNILDTSVVGGASKLWKYFLCNFQPSRIVSYADLDWSLGDLYYKLGFKLAKVGKPDYKYLIGGRRKHKSGFRKSKLNYEVTETEFTRSKGILRIWDCGKLKFEYINIF